MGQLGAWALVAAEVDGLRPFVKSISSLLPPRVRPPGRLHHHRTKDPFHMCTSGPTRTYRIGNPGVSLRGLLGTLLKEYEGRSKARSLVLI